MLIIHMYVYISIDIFRRVLYSFTTRKSTLDIGTLTSVRIATDVKSIYDIRYYKTDVF